MRTPRIAAATLLAATALSTLAAEGVDAEAAVDVSGLTASLQDGQILIAGDLAFGGAMSAGEDGADPNQEGKLPGTNLTAASVSQDGFYVSFDVAIDNMVPADPYTAPEVLQYGWDVVDGKGDPVSLSSFRSAAFQAAVGSTEPGEAYFTINTCGPDPDTGQSTCTGTDIDGEYTADGLRWKAPLSLIGTPGQTISLSGESPVHVTLGAAGLLWFNPGSPVDGDDMVAFGDFTIGGMVTYVLTDGAGNALAATNSASMTPGAISASLPAGDLLPGTYTLTATSKYADQVDSESVEITIS